MARSTTESHGRITASVDGEDLGMFDTISDISSEAPVTVRAAGGQSSATATWGGPREADAVTLTRAFVPERDHELSRRLRPKEGMADAVAREQPLDGQRLPFGTPSVYSGGVLSKVMTSGYDSASNSPRFLSLMITGGVWL